MQSLPKQIELLLISVNAPPRLIAHLTLVYDVAVQLIEKIKIVFPKLSLDEESIFFGAATHDIGKSLYRSELVETGNAHELAGEKLLLEKGIEEKFARFARTHAIWNKDESLPLEDLIVSLADNCWKGKRISELENLISEKIALETNQEVWEVFINLDDILQKLTENADERLTWQSNFSV